MRSHPPRRGWVRPSVSRPRSRRARVKAGMSCPASAARERRSRMAMPRPTLTWARAGREDPSVAGHWAPPVWSPEQDVRRVHLARGVRAQREPPQRARRAQQARRRPHPAQRTIRPDREGGVREPAVAHPDNGAGGARRDVRHSRRACLGARRERGGVQRGVEPRAPEDAGSGRIALPRGPGQSHRAPRRPHEDDVRGRAVARRQDGELVGVPSPRADRRCPRTPCRAESARHRRAAPVRRPAPAQWRPRLPPDPIPRSRHRMTRRAPISAPPRAPGTLVDGLVDQSRATASMQPHDIVGS